MNREEAKKWLPIFQAYCEGKTIEENCGGKWYELANDDILLAMSDYVWNYRVKDEGKDERK